jgi:hypothetical protein
MDASREALMHNRGALMHNRAKGALVRVIGVCALGIVLGACNDEDDRAGDEQRGACFSPQNVDNIEREGVEGCACNPEADEAVCVIICDDPSEESGVDAPCDGMAVALFCEGEQWYSGHDGPCR